MNANILPPTKTIDFSDYISWSAIAAGVVIALLLESLFNLLGLGLGLIAFTLNAEQLAGLGIGTIIWLIISGITSMFIGGWSTGIFANFSGKLSAMLHGVAMASLSLILTFLLMASAAGYLISGLANTVNQTISAASGLVPQVVKMSTNAIPNFDENVKQITQKADETLTNSPNSVKTELARTLKTLLSDSNENDNLVARQKLTALLTRNTHMSPQEAEQTINDWQQQYNQLKIETAQKTEQAKQAIAEASDKASTAIGVMSLLVFFVFLLSSIAGALGAIMTINENSNEG